MTARTLAVLTALAVIGNGALFAQQKVAIQTGDHIVIQMTGDLAAEYGQRTGAFTKDEVPAGLEIETIATIAQKLDDGQIRIEHTSHIVRDGEPMRLVTLTATVDPNKLTTRVTPKGTEVYASPGSKPTLTTKESRTSRLTISEIKGLKLRTWTLSEELGE